MIKEYNYTTPIQRRLVLLNTFFTASAAGFLFFDFTSLLQSLFLYKQVLELGLIFVFLSHFLGNFIGRLLFSKIKYSRILYIIIELLLIILCSLYFLKELILETGRDELFIKMFMNHSYVIYLFALSLGLFLGMKNIYFLKVSSGKYFDEKKGAGLFFGMMFAGILFGIIFYFLFSFSLINYFVTAFLFIPVLLTSFFIKLQFNPTVMSVKESDEPEKINTIENLFYRDDLVFNYLNFTYVIIYITIGSITAIRFYGDVFSVKLSYLMIALASICFGFLFAKFVKKPHWNIYSEMLFPVTFIVFYILMNSFWMLFPFYIGLFFFFPNGFVLGFSMRNSISCVLDKYNHEKSFSILNYAAFIMPFPITASILFIPFTNRWFFIFFYIIALINLLFPGIYIFQNRKIVVRKGIYILLFALLVPLYLLLHQYFEIPLDNNLFVSRIKGFNKIYNINSDSDYFSEVGNVYLNNRRIFHISDQSIRDLRRSVMMTSLFVDPLTSDVLIVDGYRRFFDNSVYSIFTNAVCLDYLSDSDVDYNNLPIIGRKSTITFHEDILSFVKRKTSKYNMIIDVPNLYDQRYSTFRFSLDYYKLMKSRLKNNSVFVQVVQPKYIRNFYKNNAMSNINKSYVKVIVFFFGESLVILGSDNPDLLSMSSDSLNRLDVNISRDKSFATLFFSNIQCLMHVLLSDINALDFKYVEKSKKNVTPLNMRKIISILPDSIFNQYLNENSKALELINKENLVDLSIIGQKIIQNSDIVSLIKKSELHESNYEMESESVCLAELNKIGDNNIELRKYIGGIISNKKSFYSDAAEQYIKQKNWMKTKDAYNAVLIIDPGNFTANYELALISMSLQEYDKAFAYLSAAKNLQPDNPNVYKNMGILQYTKGEFTKALEYFLNPVTLKNNDLSVYLFTAFCYEELGKFDDAKVYYLKALDIDKNNKEIKMLIERLEKKAVSGVNISNIQSSSQQKNQTEVEEDEFIPLPINKTAYERRIPDADVAKYSVFDKTENAKYLSMIEEKTAQSAPKKGVFGNMFGGTISGQQDEPIDKDEIYLQEYAPIE